jgi:hypothetical protein
MLTEALDHVFSMRSESNIEEEYAKAIQMGLSIRDRDDAQKRLARLPSP